MAELATLARPYAQAAFNYARKADNMADWSAALRAAADISTDANFRGLIGNPRLSKERLCELLFDIGGTQFSEEIKRFFSTVVDNDRLMLLPEVSSIYDDLLNQVENRVDVEVISAYAVKKDHQAMLTKVLEKRLGKSVELRTRIDKTLIGGAIIRIGDEVIDGSLLGGLKQMATQLHSS